MRGRRMSAVATDGDATGARTVWAVILALSVAHTLNDVVQSLLSALFPVLHDEFALSFGQIGFLAFAFSVTASILQPVVGLVTDRRAMPHSLAVGMAVNIGGVLMLAWSQSYAGLVIGAVLVGVGSAVFHPEASRVARMAAGGRFGTAQSLFQAGGNIGHAVGPLLAAFVVVPLGRPSLALVSLVAVAGVIVLGRVGAWHARALAERATQRASSVRPEPLGRGRIGLALGVLVILVFSKHIYSAAMTSYYTFYLIERFGFGTQGAQLMLFLFLGATVVGVATGGFVGDRFGALAVIWISILGVLPFTLMLPHVGPVAAGMMSVAIGIVLSAAFPAILVMAQEMVPGRVGLIGGIFFGLAFGVGGVAAAALGLLADARGIVAVFEICAWLPAAGLLAVFLPRRAALRAG